MEKKKITGKEVESAFQNIFKKEDKVAKEEAKIPGLEMDTEKFQAIIEEKDYDRRLTIPLSRMQEKYLEDLIHEIHKNRNQKSQRLTKASLIRAMINNHYAMKNKFDIIEIENEDSLSERFFLYYKKYL